MPRIDWSRIMPDEEVKDTKKKTIPEIQKESLEMFENTLKDIKSGKYSLYTDKEIKNFERMVNELRQRDFDKEYEEYQNRIKELDRKHQEKMRILDEEFEKLSIELEKW